MPDGSVPQATFARDAAKIVARLHDPHTIRTRNVSQDWTPVDILFVGEAPGADEDKRGEPFVGRSGKLLRDVVADVVLKHHPDVRVGYSNLVRCRPPRNREPSRTEIASCAPELLREIAARKPKVLVPLGNASLGYLTGMTGITTVCGCVVPCTVRGLEDMRVVPCVHPAYVLRADHEIDRFADAIGKAGEVACGGYRPRKGAGRYVTLTSADDVEALVDALLEDGRRGVVTAFDTETGSLTPFQDRFPRLLCFSFSNEEGTGYVVPFDHPESPYLRDVNARERVKAALVRFFSADVPRVGQNEKFDRQHIQHALGVEIAGLVYDTMTMHMLIDERRGTHGLDRLAVHYTGMGGYHKPLDDYVRSHKDADPSRGGSYAHIPADLLFAYAAADADVTLRVFHRLRSLPEYKENERFQVIAEKYLPRLSRTLARMEYAGARRDEKVVLRLRDEWESKRAGAESAIRADAQVQRYEADRKAENPKFVFNPGSDAQVGKVLWDYYRLLPGEFTDTGFDVAAARLTRAVKHNPSATLSDIAAEMVRRKEWSMFSTKSDVLNGYAREGNVLAPLILAYREASKLLGTYIEPMLHQAVDGMIHGSFHMGGAATGRLSSSDPNLQNIPLSMRKAYCSRFDDGYILSADYSQIELRVAASLFRDRPMIQTYRKGDDLHLRTCLEVFGMTEQEYRALPKEVQKERRTCAKAVNFGIIYSIGPEGLQTALRRNGVFVSVSRCERMIRAFENAHQDLVGNMERLWRQVRRTGQVVSYTGRVRRLPEVFSSLPELVGRARRQAINFPVQYGAAEMTLMALVLIDEEIRRRGWRSVPIVTVHDSIVVDCPAKEVVPVAKMMKRIMEHLPDYADAVLPGIDWSWLRVPIVAEFDVGKSWGGVEFDPDAITSRRPDSPLYGQDGKLARRPATERELFECAVAA